VLYAENAFRPLPPGGLLGAERRVARGPGSPRPPSSDPFQPACCSGSRRSS